MSSSVLVLFGKKELTCSSFYIFGNKASGLGAFTYSRLSEVDKIV